MEQCGLEPVWPGLPPGLEACRRTAPDGRHTVILVNHTRSALTAPAHPAIDSRWTELLAGAGTDGPFKIEGYGVRVFSLVPGAQTGAEGRPA